MSQLPQKPPIWQLPALIAGGIAALTALGTGIVMASKYIQLPEAVAGVQQQNRLQDDAILELKKSNEIWQKIYEAQKPSVEELSDNGEIKVLMFRGEKVCADGREIWKWSKRTKCARLRDE